MTNSKLDDFIQNNYQRNAINWVVVTYGVLSAILGIEHGLFEILQGNNTPTVAPLGLEVDSFGFGFIIDAIGPNQKYWLGASEPAFTLIPNFLITGIITIIIGLIIIFWSVRLIDKKFGARVSFFLCITLFLTGGGSPPLTFGIISSIVATRINKPLSWWRTHLSVTWQHNLLRLWPWSLISTVLVSLLGTEMAIFGFPFSLFLDINTFTVLLLCVGQLSMILAVFTIITALAYDIQQKSI
ncbi:MAG: hypothetical protein ACFFB5_17005 [Promethearchaeota archaeon]